jgi:hypothetical protein
MANKIFIFVPAFGQIITATTFLTTHALQQHLGSKGIGGGVSTLSFPDIAELRSMAMTIWYDTMPDVNHLLFIDADMGFAPEMVTDMLLFDEALIGTIYPQRKMPLSWAGSGTGQPTTERRGNFMHVEGVGMGCTLIRRDLVTKMLEQMPELVDTRLQLHPAGDTLRQAGTNRLIRAFEKLDLPERGLVSEDLSFCIRAARCGVKCWAAIAYKISHVGPFDYSGRYLDMIETQAANLAVMASASTAATTQQTALPPVLPVSTGGTATSEALTVVGDPATQAALERIALGPVKDTEADIPDVIADPALPSKTAVPANEIVVESDRQLQAAE